MRTHGKRQPFIMLFKWLLGLAIAAVGALVGGLVNYISKLKQAQKETKIIRKQMQLPRKHKGLCCWKQ